jgi:HAD superfamily hydrolase (TIGR01490 family)
VIDAVPSQPRVGAFFDVDHTLIACNSARKWVEYLWRNGQISVSAALRSVWWLVKYRLSVLDYEAVTAEVVADYAGKSVDELAAEVEAWFHADVEPQICVEGRAQVEWHRARGHTLVLLTSGTFFSVAPLQKNLDVPHLVCTQLEIIDHHLTGKHLPPSCFGPGKLRAALAFAEQHGIDLDQSYFYTDSFSDLPMLERVGNPRIVNPDPRLRHWASEAGLTWEQWHAEAEQPLQVGAKQPVVENLSARPGDRADSDSLRGRA